MSHAALPAMDPTAVGAAAAQVLPPTVTSFAGIADGGILVANGSVPSLLGVSARRAVMLLAARGIEAELVGSGTVVRQEPAAGAPLADGQRVRVILEPGNGAPVPILAEQADSGVQERR